MMLINPTLFAVAKVNELLLLLLDWHRGEERERESELNPKGCWKEKREEKRRD